MKKVALYCRVSTSHQTVDSQILELRKYCLQRNFQIFNEYIDISSGAKKERAALNSLLNDARKRRFDLILVFRFDRMARSSSHLLNLLNEFRLLNIDFISYQENIDTSSPIGQAMFTIISAMAQLERDIIRERVMAGLEAARFKGKSLGRPNKRNDQLISTYRTEGHSIRKIASIMNVSVSSVQRSLANVQK